MYCSGNCLKELMMMMIIIIIAIKANVQVGI
jgi:hypothetical protein